MKSIIALLFVSALAFGQSSAVLPQRDPVLVTDLKQQFADCVINSASDQRYLAKLMALIGDLQKENAELKDKLGKLEPKDEKK